MKCTASNRTFRRQRIHDYGMKEAVRRVSFILDYVLSDKNRYKNVRINQIHSSIDRVIEKVEKGDTTIAELNYILKTQHDINIDFEESHKTRPQGLRSDYINGVFAAQDSINVILCYVLAHMYRIGRDKLNKIMSDMNKAITLYNQGYVTENDIRRALRQEEGLEVRNIKELKK